MDLEPLKAALGDDAHAKLTAYVADLIGQRDSARAESIEHRKGLKAKLSDLEKAQSDLLERLGIDSLDDLKDLDPKGQAEAAKQYETKLKRLERDLAERQQQVDEIGTRYRASQQDAALRKALSGHDWIDQDLVASFAQARLAWEDDQVLYKTDSGSLVPLDDGVQTLAKAKPHLLKSTGAGGSGYRKPGIGEAGERNPWKKETFNLTEQIRLASDNPQLAAQLKASSAA